MNLICVGFMHATVLIFELACRRFSLHGNGGNVYAST